MHSVTAPAALRGRAVLPLLAVALVAAAGIAVWALATPALQAMALLAALVLLVATAAAAGWWASQARPGSTDAAASQVQPTPAGPSVPIAPDPAPADAAETVAIVNMLSHDLRAPIRVVDGFARILKEDYGHALDRIGNDHLDRVLAASARMNLMIDAMLAQSRLAQQPLSRQPVDMSRVAQFVIEDLRRSAPERDAEIDIEGGLVVQGDPTLLRQVMENLLSNAWKYSARSRPARIALRRLPDMAAGFVVSDNGAGFDMRFADRLFGMFQRLHSASDYPGTGVGLASVQRIVQRHGGRIWAESEVGQGARFFVALP
ncbi:MAG: sensor histidine kinase [Aquabacterium sp.]